MTTFIKAILQKFNDQTNIDKYRVATNIYQNIILYHYLSKIHNDKAIISSKYVCNNDKKDNRVTTLNKFYLTVSGIIISNLKSKDNSNMPK